MEVVGYRHAPGSHFTPRNNPVPFVRSLSLHQDWSGQVYKIFLPTGFDPQTNQHIASHYTVSAIPDHHHCAIFQRSFLCITPYL